MSDTNRAETVMLFLRPENSSNRISAATDSGTCRPHASRVRNLKVLTVPPGIWMAFEGLSDETNMLLNISSIPHDPAEAESLPLKNDIIPFTGFA